MAKQTVEEVLTEIAAKVDDDGDKVLNRFNRKNFDKLVSAAAADPNFTAQVAQIKKGEFDSYKDIAVGENFRKWVKSVVEKAGVDPKESDVVMGDSFPMGNMDWMFDFFAEVMWRYLQDNKIDLPKKHGFEATLQLKDVDATVTVGKKSKPGGEVLGIYETKKEKHKVLKVKSSCPSYLVSRVKIRDAGEDD